MTLPVYTFPAQGGESGLRGHWPGQTSPSQVFEGQALTPKLVSRAAEVATAEVWPITDIRGSEGYRRMLVGKLTRRLLHGGREPDDDSAEFPW
jgi:xanthine dehydrogenase iron-sulfur cluster and FAD-binding subunit A